MRRLRERLRPPSEDQGYGLPELLVAMFLLSIITALVVALVSNFSQTFTRERSAVESTNTAAIGMNEMTRVIRSGTEIRVSGHHLNRPVFLDARNDRMTLHAYLDTDSVDPRPVKVEFSIDASRELIESRWYAEPASKPYWTFGSAGRPADTSRPIARKIPPPGPGDSPLFTYRSAEVCPDNDEGCNVLPLGPGGALSDANRRLVAIVEIDLTVQADVTGRAEPVNLQNQVGLPNLGIDRVGATT